MYGPCMYVLNDKLAELPNKNARTNNHLGDSFTEVRNEDQEH